MSDPLPLRDLALRFVARTFLFPEDAAGRGRKRIRKGGLPVEIMELLRDERNKLVDGIPIPNALAGAILDMGYRLRVVETGKGSDAALFCDFQLGFQDKFANSHPGNGPKTCPTRPRRQRGSLEAETDSSDSDYFESDSDSDHSSARLDPEGPDSDPDIEPAAPTPSEREALVYKVCSNGDAAADMPSRMSVDLFADLLAVREVRLTVFPELYRPYKDVGPELWKEHERLDDVIRTMAAALARQLH